MARAVIAMYTLTASESTAQTRPRARSTPASRSTASSVASATSCGTSRPPSERTAAGSGVDDRVGDTVVVELAGRSLADAAEAADEEVIAETLEASMHPSFAQPFCELSRREELGARADSGEQRDEAEKDDGDGEELTVGVEGAWTSRKPTVVSVITLM